MLKIAAIETNNGYYISANEFSSNYDMAYGGSCVDGYYFDGERPEKTFDNNWRYIKTKPQRIYKLEKQSDINHRYELIDKSLADKFPLVYTHDEVVSHYDDGYVWKEELKHLASLYKRVSDKQPDKEVDVQFEFDVILKVDFISKPDDKLFYNVSRTSVQHQMLDKIIYPSIMLHKRPCKLSSHEVYTVLRNYIKDNIDPKHAIITSDYNFCFTVKKRIKVAKPYTHTWQTKSGRRYITKSRYVEDKDVDCFEMTWSPENYRGYTPISAIVAESEEDLATKIEEKCLSVINMINEPISECPHCNGTGVSSNSKGAQ